MNKFRGFYKTKNFFSKWIFQAQKCYFKILRFQLSLTCMNTGHSQMRRWWWRWWCWHWASVIYIHIYIYIYQDTLDDGFIIIFIKIYIYNIHIILYGAKNTMGSETKLFSLSRRRNPEANPPPTKTGWSTRTAQRVLHPWKTWTCLSSSTAQSFSIADTIQEHSAQREIKKKKKKNEEEGEKETLSPSWN